MAFIMILYLIFWNLQLLNLLYFFLRDKIRALRSQKWYFWNFLLGNTIQNSKKTYKHNSNFIIICFLVDKILLIVLLIKLLNPYLFLLSS